jgi:methyl-accepting chemotaxis protein
MTDIRENENDLFVRIKDYLILFSTIYLQTVNLTHVAMYYIADPPRPPVFPAFPLSILLVTLYGTLLYFAMLELSKKEERYQRRMLQHRVGELSKAEGDLTQRITLINFDEIGDIAHHFNAFLAGLAQIVRQIGTFTQGLAQTGNELSQQMEQTQHAVEQNSENIENIRREIMTQASSVTESTASVEQISQNISSLESLITDQASSVTESSAAVEQMVANISSITGNLENVVKNFTALIDASKEGKEKISFVSAQIAEVAEQSESLAQANKLISGITAQTNLLAMNAAIEAAHAGDAGRGFAVVADEIRSLAENSANQSKAINRELAATQEVITRVVEATGEAERAFDNVRSLIDSTNDLERQAMESMEEQRAGSTEVLKALTVINDITTKVQAASSEMGSGSTAVMAEMQNLLKMTESVRENIDAIASRTSEITGNVRAVSELTQKNRENIAGVLKENGRFRVEAQDRLY